MLLSASLPLHAVEPNEMLANPTLEARARALSKELRCMVCQNQSIDDSEAPLAHDLRVLVRERLKAGDSDAQVIDFLVARYGEFVLLRPPLVVAHGRPVGPAARRSDHRDRADRLVVIRAKPRRRRHMRRQISRPAEEARLSELLRD